MIRAVIDTNVLVSAMISSTGNEALVVMGVNQELVVPCLSIEVIQEYSDVLRRPKFSFSTREVKALLGLLRDRGRLYDPAPTAYVSPDPGDDKFIACALAGKADFLVTGNKRHSPRHEYGRATVVNAAELLEFITLDL